MEDGKIFISYRREDTSGESGRLKDKLEQVFGKENIFYDVETLEAGLNFDQSIAKALNESKVLLAMIGPHWLKSADSKGERRLLKPTDWVRKEIAEAINRGIRVIPVLVNGAEMPDPDELPEDLKELSFKHAQELTSSRWNYDVGVLTQVLEKIINKKPESQPEPLSYSKSQTFPKLTQGGRFSKNYLWAIGGFVVFSFLIVKCINNNSDNYLEENSVYTTIEADPTQDLNQFIPETGVRWILEEKRNSEEYSTILVFENREDELYFLEYNEGTVSGGGSVQIDNQNLVLMFTKSNYDSTGKIILESLDLGMTWEGKSNYPQYRETYNARLYKER